MIIAKAVLVRISPLLDPGRSKRLFKAVEPLHASDLAVVQRVEGSESLVELDAPAPRPGTLANRHHDSLAARVDERLGLSTEALKRTHEVGHRLRRVRPPKGGPLRMAGHETHLELRVDEPPHGGETALCECLKHLAHQVDIARPHRHRLSQAILL